ncbi:MAG: transposase [Bacteroidetes bacterium]|jgi:REP element-mobilizing transposase RayT|nr:transposase [Bacteroidota bacterium]
MSRKYKFYNPAGLYFVSFATVYWVDVFVRDVYCNEIVKNLDYCRQHKGMQVFAWCIMPSHIHLIMRTDEGKPDQVLGKFKEITAKKIMADIQQNPKESRKEWLLWIFKQAGLKSTNVSDQQFWQHNNQPIELWSNKVIDQKLDYLHDNPVEAGFVLEPWHWKYSSAVDYAGGKGLLKIEKLE